jgi:hypothetical protein
MRRFFLSDQRLDLRAMVEEVTQGVHDLGLRERQRLGDIRDASPCLKRVAICRTVTRSPSLTGSPPHRPSTRTICGCSVFTTLAIAGYLIDSYAVSFNENNFIMP